MVRIEHMYKEPIVIYLLRPNNQRVRCNLLMGQSVEVDDSEISPELRHLERRGHVKLVPLPSAPVPSKDRSVEEDPMVPPGAASSPIDEIDIATLEKELLK